MAITLFNEVAGGVAIVRKAPGVLLQVPLYSRGKQVFIKQSGGFVRISDKLGDTYLTVHPSFKVLELEGAGIKLDGAKAPEFSAGWGA